MLANFPESGISNETVTLVKFTENHITEKYLSWLNDKEIVKYSNQRFVKHSKESSLEYLASFLENQNLFLAILDTKTHITIGTMTAYINLNHNTADIGILIGEKSSWGKGYGYRSWCLLVDWLLDIQKVRKVTAGTSSKNIGMINILRKSNMQREAIRKSQEIFDGIETDIFLFSKFKK